MLSRQLDGDRGALVCNALVCSMLTLGMACSRLPWKYILSRGIPSLWFSRLHVGSDKSALIALVVFASMQGMSDGEFSPYRWDAWTVRSFTTLNLECEGHAERHCLTAWRELCRVYVHHVLAQRCGTPAAAAAVLISLLGRLRRTGKVSFGKTVVGFPAEPGSRPVAVLATGASYDSEVRGRWVR